MIRECLHGYAACISDSINKVFEVDKCMHVTVAGFHRSGIAGVEVEWQPVVIGNYNRVSVVRVSEMDEDLRKRSKLKERAAISEHSRGKVLSEEAQGEEGNLFHLGVCMPRLVIT